MRDALSDLAGGPLSDWVWKRATLASSMGGLNLRSASLHASAAFISSLDQCQPLTTRILGRPTVTSPHLTEAISVLAKVVTQPNWISMSLAVNIHFRVRSMR